MSSVGLKIGVISMRRHWYAYGTYFVGLVLFAIFVVNSGNNFSMKVHYYQVVNDVSEFDGLVAKSPKFRMDQYTLLKRTFEARRELLKRACAKYANPFRVESESITSARVDSSRFFFMKNPDFLMCMIPKVASTTFSRFLLQAHQKIRPKGMHNLGYNRSFEQSVSEKTYKAMVVRHPMDRLLSAYIYIFRKEVKADRDRTNMYSNLTRLLIENYRAQEETHNGDGDGGLLTFPEFIRFLVNGTSENLKGDWQPRTPDQPADFWITDENINAHWVPYWKACTPCVPETRPTAILKMDGGDLANEAGYVFQESGVIDFFKSKGLTNKDLRVPWINQRDFEDDEDNNKDVVRQKYFSQITKKNVREVYAKYELDHELFGYDVEPFLSLAA